MAETETLTQSEERQLVVFDLAGEVYGVDIGTVREIIRMQEITHVPNAPDFVEGVINLRGKVIPIVDLRKRFTLAASEQTKDSRIVVVDIAGEDIGVTVDGVREVMRLPADSIEKTSDVITTENSYYIEGIANLGERLIIMLDLDKVLSKEERAALTQAKQTEPGQRDTQETVPSGESAQPATTT